MRWGLFPKNVLHCVAKQYLIGMDGMVFSSMVWYSAVWYGIQQYRSKHYLLTFDTFDSLTGSWSVWPHVVTPQWLIKKYIFFQYI